MYRHLVVAGVDKIEVDRNVNQFGRPCSEHLKLLAIVMWDLSGRCRWSSQYPIIKISDNIRFARETHPVF